VRKKDIYKKGLVGGGFMYIAAGLMTSIAVGNGECRPSTLDFKRQSAVESRARIAVPASDVPRPSLLVRVATLNAADTSCKHTHIDSRTSAIPCYIQTLRTVFPPHSHIYVDSRTSTLQPYAEFLTSTL
jgi:hypothetical protein